MQTRIITLMVAARRVQVFNFLANIENLPAWTGGLCEWLELHRNGWWAYTALGELAVSMQVDDLNGSIELKLTPVSERDCLISLGVRSDGEEGSLVRLNCVQPAGWSDEHFQLLVDALLTGLHGLTDRKWYERGDLSGSTRAKQDEANSDPAPAGMVRPSY